LERTGILAQDETDQTQGGVFVDQRAVEVEDRRRRGCGIFLPPILRHDRPTLETASGIKSCTGIPRFRGRGSPPQQAHDAARPGGAVGEGSYHAEIWHRSFLGGPVA